MVQIEIFRAVEESSRIGRDMERDEEKSTWLEKLEDKLYTISEVSSIIQFRLLVVLMRIGRSSTVNSLNRSSCWRSSSLFSIFLDIAILSSSTRLGKLSSLVVSLDILSSRRTVLKSPF